MLAGEIWASEYEDPVRSLVYSAKYGADRASAVTLAAILGRVVLSSGLASRLDVLVAVPCHWRKGLLRSGDPAVWLCEELGVLLGLPRVRGALRRVHETPALGQFGSDRRRREEALGDAFRARHHPRLWRARVGLVDDIRTTGATAEACARALRAAGAGMVTLLVVTSGATHDPASPQPRTSRKR